MNLVLQGSPLGNDALGEIVALTGASHVATLGPGAWRLTSASQDAPVEPWCAQRDESGGADGLEREDPGSCFRCDPEGNRDRRERDAGHGHDDAHEGGHWRLLSGRRAWGPDSS